MLDAVVVGAGPAGIGAARALLARARSVQVLEARQRPGGRAFTQMLPGGGVFDHGAHWLHSPGLNPLAPHAKRLGIAVGAPLTERFYAGSGFLDDPRIASAMDAAFDAVGQGAEAARAAAGDWRPGFEAAFVSKVGVTLDETDPADFAAYLWEGEDRPVTGGYGRVVAALAEDLPVRYGAPVTEVEFVPGGVAVSGGWGRAEARHAIVTCPLGVLRAGAIRFRPGLPAATLAAIEAMPMGVCNKVAVEFAAPLPGAPSLLIPAGGDAVPEEVALHADGRTAVGMVHGAFGRDLTRAGPGAMREWLLERLASLLGSAVRRSALPETHIADWDADPWTRGYVACPLPGAAGARRALAEPVEGRLHFAGEAVSVEFQGDVHGAWLAGEQAAARV